MDKNKVKVEELLYRPEHRVGVLAALKAYNERRSRKQGYHKANQGKRMHYGASQAFSGLF
jgi:hypothetical protein